MENYENYWNPLVFVFSMFPLLLLSACLLFPLLSFSLRGFRCVRKKWVQRLYFSQRLALERNHFNKSIPQRYFGNWRLPNFKMFPQRHGNDSQWESIFLESIFWSRIIAKENLWESAFSCSSASSKTLLGNVHFSMWRQRKRYTIEKVNIVSVSHFQVAVGISPTWASMIL